MGGNSDDKAKRDAADMDLGLQYGEPTALDKAMLDNRKRPLTAEELSGFGRAKPKPPKGLTVRPFIKVKTPSKEDGPKGISVIVGIKGTF